MSLNSNRPFKYQTLAVILPRSFHYIIGAACGQLPSSLPRSHFLASYQSIRMKKVDILQGSILVPHGEFFYSLTSCVTKSLLQFLEQHPSR